jgi:hypothetical protein
VHVAIIGIASFIVGAAFLIGVLIDSAAKLAGHVSHLSGLWWLVGGIVAYLVVCLFVFSLMKVAAVSDERIAESGGAL